MQSQTLSIHALSPFVRSKVDLYQLDVHLKGIHCSHCVYKIQKTLDENSEISKYQMSAGGSKLSLYAKEISSFSQAIHSIGEQGFEAIPVLATEILEKEELQFKSAIKRLAVAGVCAGNIMLFSAANYLGAPDLFKDFFNFLSFLLSLPVVLYSAQPIWSGFYRGISKRRFNLDLPIGLAVGFGFGLSLYSLLTRGEDLYFDSVSVVIFIILGSRFLLDNYLKQIYQKNLNQCVPGVYQARRIVDGNESLVSPKSLALGDLVKILKSEVCPVDGEVISEEAIVDTSVLTGEEEPQVLKKGDVIYAGSKLVVGSSLVKVKSVDNETRVGKLVNENLKAIKWSEEESFIYVGYFTLLVVLVSFFSFIYFSLTSGYSLAFQRSFAIIIVACPCAVSFGIPLIRLLSGRLCFSSSILVKKPNLLSKVINVKNICFDKTGTLTDSVVEISLEDFSNFDIDDQGLILSLELAMDHPISRGFFVLKNDKHKIYEVDKFNYLPGKGIQGYVKHHFVEILSLPKDSNISSLNKKYLFIYKDNILLGQIGVHSSLKKTALTTIKKLQAMDKSISLLSGDNFESVKALWAQVPSERKGQFLYQAAPEDKEKFIASLKGETMMVGDGVNDIAAIKKAYIGVTMPGALENNLDVSDISFLKGDLNLVEKIFAIAKKVRRAEVSLLTFTTLYNTSTILLALFGYISPIVAAILMPISSLIVLTIVGSQLRNL